MKQRPAPGPLAAARFRHRLAAPLVPSAPVTSAPILLVPVVLAIVLFALVLLAAFALLPGCSSSDKGVKAVAIPADSRPYIVLAWNDLGMHCLNPTYDRAVILPPYNTVFAQVIERGDPPHVVTEGLTVEYRLVDNTSSYGKTDALGGRFAQFWDNCQALFGATVAQDHGLNLEDPQISNGLAGTMVLKGDHFQVNGIPVVPVLDDGTWNPFQVAEVTVKKAGVVVAQTRATVPTSDEIRCARCHGEEGVDPFQDILEKHDEEHGTALAASGPVLCARPDCHHSPALGQSEPGPAGYLSAAIHGAHATREAACYDCHPGTQTKCNRSLAHTADNGNCTNCHGDLAHVASTIRTGGRVPWAEEPKCVSCHAGIPQVDTGTALYRNAKGHGGVYCTGCHQSPHAMVPSREASDNSQAEQYQTNAKSLGTCAVCHDNSHGKGIGEFNEEHGGTKGRHNACHVCHTAVNAQTASWPHEFGWKAR